MGDLACDQILRVTIFAMFLCALYFTPKIVSFLLFFFSYTNDELVGLGFFYLHDSCNNFEIYKITEEYRL